MRADFARRRVLSRWLLLVAIMGVAAACAALWGLHEVQRVNALLRAETAAIDTAAASPRTLIPPLPEPYDASAREMLAQHESRWPELLAVLESTAVDGVRLISLDFEAAAGAARIEIAFAQQKQALFFLQQLNQALPVRGKVWRWSLVRMEDRRDGQPGSAFYLGRLSE